MLQRVVNSINLSLVNEPSKKYAAVIYVRFQIDWTDSLRRLEGVKRPGDAYTIT